MKKCAIYTRVSTDMQAEKEFNSCEAQEEKIKSFIKSQNNMQIVNIYTDPGYSGANIKRPALQELLEDITKNQIDIVFCYKIDRLTRSPKDFYQLIELFEQNEVAFISVTERFDTSTPSGRLLRNIMLTFSQFERELISERTRDKMHQRAQKGMWNGGIVPFGYKRIEKKLVKEENEAKIVKLIFKTFISKNCITPVYNELKRRRITNRQGKTFSKGAISCILRNIVHAGKVKYANKIYAGIHEAIISEELFNLAQTKHKDKNKKYMLFHKCLFAGLIKCKECGYSMSPAFTNKHKNGKLKRYFYYRCISTQKQDWNNCSVKQVSADRVENFVLDNLKRIALDTSYLDSFIFTLNHKPSGYRKGLELQDTDLKFSAEITRNLINSALKTAKETKGIERNLQIRKYIEGISYSPSEIRINLKYNPAGGQTIEPVPGGGGTGSIVEQTTPSWGAGDRRNVAENCEPADKGSSACCEGRAGRPSEIIVRNEMNGCRGRTRTSNAQIQSLVSYQLNDPAMVQNTKLQM